MVKHHEWGDELPTLTGSRLDLRHLTPEDAPAILTIFGDPDVTKFWSSPPLADLAAAREVIADVHRLYDTRQLFQWGICSRETNQVFGTCTLHNVSLPHRRAEVGFALGRTAWGRGLATEALETMIGFAFDSLDLHRLEADVDPLNDRSIRLLERQGFQREGYLRERWHQAGQRHDGVFFGLLRREWSPKRRV